MTGNSLVYDLPSTPSPRYADSLTNRNRKTRTIVAIRRAFKPWKFLQILRSVINEMSSSSSSVRNILNIPDEILAKIILHFNARERVAVGNSCERFNSLVFGDKELLRDLNFSKEGQLTSPTDIQQYFTNESTYRQILKINIQNVKSMSSGQMLSISISKAINVVDLNVHGAKFKDIKELSSFLNPLIHLKRLSIDWLKSGKSNNIWHPDLQKPLSRLTYLSVELYINANVFVPIVQLCHELEELRLSTITPRSRRMASLSMSLQPNKLENLKVILFRGQEWPVALKDRLMAIVPHTKYWTDFHLVQPHREGYLGIFSPLPISGTLPFHDSVYQINHLIRILRQIHKCRICFPEKNVEVCDELWKVKLMPPSGRFSYPDCSNNDDIGWPLLSEFLLKEVINITHEDAAGKFCCLSNTGGLSSQPCQLRIDEAKQLLKDPGYQISYLNFIHSIDPDCDAHLVVSAFPNLSELVFSQITNRRAHLQGSSPRRLRPLRRHLRKRGSTAPAEQDDPTNLDSSFKILVENTPQLKGLTICPENMNCDNDLNWWDVDALYLISRWKNLTAIRLKNIPFTDGNFLIDVGKECTKLEEVLLYHLGPRDRCHYINEVLQMLKHCRNLRKFSICERGIEKMSEVFGMLSNIPKLRKVRLMTKTEAYDSQELISSIEQMLHRCPELIKFVLMVQSGLDRVDEELKPALQRIVADLNRANFQFFGPTPSRPNTVYDDAPTSFFFSPLDDRQFADY